MVLNGGVERKVQHFDAMQWCVEWEEREVELVQLCWILRHTGPTVLNSAPYGTPTVMWQVLIGCLDFTHFNKFELNYFIANYYYFLFLPKFMIFFVYKYRLSSFDLDTEKTPSFSLSWFYYYLSISFFFCHVLRLLYCILS